MPLCGCLARQLLILLRVRHSDSMWPFLLQCVTIKAVLHVPEATVNLFSTRQAMNSGAQITFRDNRCFVSSNDTVTMEGVSQRDGTMVIRQSRQQPAICIGSHNSSQAITRAMA